MFTPRAPAGTAAAPTGVFAVEVGPGGTPGSSATLEGFPSSTPPGGAGGGGLSLDSWWPIAAALALVSLLLAAAVMRLWLYWAPRSLTLLPSHRFDDMGFALMRLQKIDEANRLKLRLTHWQHPDEATQAFRDGASDVLLTTPDVALKLAAEGQDVHLIYTYSRWLAAAGLATRANIQTPAGLRGHSIAIGPDAASRFLLHRMLGDARLGENEITLVPTPRDQIVQALSSGRVDAILIWGPALEAAAKASNARLLATVRDYPGLEWNAIVVRGAALKAHFETFRRLLKAWDLMRAEYESEPGRFWEALARYQGRSAADVAAEAGNFQLLGVNDNRDMSGIAAMLRNVYTHVRVHNPNLPPVDPASIFDPSVINSV